MPCVCFVSYNKRTYTRRRFFMVLIVGEWHGPNTVAHFYETNSEGSPPNLSTTRASMLTWLQILIDRIKYAQNALRTLMFTPFLAVQVNGLERPSNIRSQRKITVPPPNISTTRAAMLTLVADSDRAHQIFPECAQNTTLYSIPGGSIEREKFILTVSSIKPAAW